MKNVATLKCLGITNCQVDAVLLLKEGARQLRINFKLLQDFIIYEISHNFIAIRKWYLEQTG